ncbi:MAG: 3,4-dihydroxy-2-butanone-4-phosphate synthase, partial [Hyphomicrobiales bacterium]
MKLDAWLQQTKTGRSAFARQVGLSPASVTALCNDPTAWISRESAERIAAATGGAVTPNDFLGLQGPREAAMTASNVAETVEAFARGEIVIVTDDDDRENEGDLIVA